MNKISIVCLGVADMARAIRFYRDGLGFETEEKGDSPNVVFFNTLGTKFELFPIEKLALDINATQPPQRELGFGGITLAYNVAHKAMVDQVIEKARQAGAMVVKEPTDVFWGGYHGYFTDLDGYYWEVAWGPDFKYDAQGLLDFGAH